MEAEAVRMVDSHRRNSLDSLDGAAGDCRDNQAAAEGILQREERMRWNENGRREIRRRRDLTGRRVGFRRSMVVAVRVTHNFLQNGNGGWRKLKEIEGN